MATLYIAEYSAGGGAGGEQVAGEPLRVQTGVSIAASSAQSAAVGDGTKKVRLFADATCFVAFGANPTASATAGIPLAAESTEYFFVNPSDKIAVISR